nr:T9SS type A sorting domain-containing protein [Ignavibacteria bacterium]
QVIGIEPISSIIPDRYMLYNNYPNPFNPVTTINFDIPSGVDTDVELVIYDVTGRIAAVLVNSALRPGKYSAVWNASGFASGVYFYRLSAGKFTDIKKMIVVK